MDNISENEQWKSSGDCNKCRRIEYCNKACSAHKKRVERIVKGAIGKRMPKLIYDCAYKE